MKSSRRANLPMRDSTHDGGVFFLCFMSNSSQSLATVLAAGAFPIATFGCTLATRGTPRMEILDHARSKITRDASFPRKRESTRRGSPIARGRRGFSIPGVGQRPMKTRSKITRHASFPRKRESTFSWTDVDPRPSASSGQALRGGDENGDFHLLGWAAGPWALGTTTGVR